MADLFEGRAVIQVHTNFEGANPRDAAAVEQTGESAFVIRPYSEDGDDNYKFSLLVRVSNDATRWAPLDLTIDWADPVYMSCRDYVLLGRGDRWRYFPAKIDGGLGRAEVIVPPGRHELALHPTYGLDRLRTWARRAERDKTLELCELGRTRQGRPILAWELGGAPQNVRHRLAVMARAHPYETGGSFAAEGALRQFAKTVDASAPADWHASVVLIANPDGVADGLCKRTARGGADPSHVGPDCGDPTVVVLHQWLDELRPTLMLDFHSWMYRYEDGMTYTDDALSRQFRERLETSRDLDRAWKLSDHTGPAKMPAPWHHCRDRFGTRSLVLSFGWYGRTVPHMRRIGAAVMSALAESAA
jgi:hypothetical protein